MKIIPLKPTHGQALFSCFLFFLHRYYTVDHIITFTVSHSRAEALKAHFERGSDATPRPILTSLNGDNSWLISFPRPPAEQTRLGSKAYFHVVSDPWLVGDAATVHSWLVLIHLSAPPSIADGDAAAAVVKEIEDAAAAAGTFAGTRTRDNKPKRGSEAKSESESESEASPIDAIFLNFHYPDHLHEKTLRTFRPDTPVFATAEAAAIARPWGYFHHITEMRDLNPADAR